MELIEVTFGADEKPQPLLDRVQQCSFMYGLTSSVDLGCVHGGYAWMPALVYLSRHFFAKSRVVSLAAGQ